MNTKEMIEVMQAFENGQEIEYKSNSELKWLPVKATVWNWQHFNYRIKPKPTYRPYKLEESHLLIGLTIWREIDLGRVKQIVTIMHINESSPCPIRFGSYTWSLEDTFKEWKFYDTTTHTFTDTPVGILEDA